jgi:hypothetical protein
MTSPAFDQSAPADERYDAQSELQKASISRADIVHSDNIRPMIDHVANLWREQQMLKANVIPFPSKNAGKKGMQSVKIDDLTITLQGDYIERPGNMSFDMLRAMVDQTPVLGAVMLTRIRQVNAFCKVQESGDGPGFTINHIDKTHQLTKSEDESVQLLQRFFINCGWEFNPRKRKILGRDTFSSFMAKAVRDSLVMDSCAIETEFKRDRSLGIDGLYAVDGATIRLCSEEGYRGDDKIYALQVIQGQIRAAYSHYDLVYEPRNPQSNVLTAGYGLSETELLVRVVTGFLNAMTLNIRGFSDNSIPRGVLHMTGNYGADDLAAFKRYWNSMVKGVNNSWTVPVMISKDQESKASFENFGVEFNEMYFSKWMTFLASIICAVYGIAPDEINFESFSSGKSALSGSDTAERLADSKDKGLRPLLSYFENLFTDYVLGDFGDKYVFRWTGVDEVDQEKRHELKKAILSINEIRAQEGYEKSDAVWGDAPANPSLVGAWMNDMQQQQQAEQGPDTSGEEQHPDYKEDGEDGAEEQDGSEQKDENDDDEGKGGIVGAGSGSVGSDNSGGDRAGDDDKSGLAKSGDALGESLLKANQYGVGIDDEVFYSHPESGVTSGRVRAIGKDGMTVDAGDGKFSGVLWDAFRGHKKRAERQYHVVDRGESGSVVEDPLTGKRHFLSGEMPEDDEDMADEREIVLGKPLVKSDPTVVEKTVYLPAESPAPVINVAATDMQPLVDAMQKAMADQTNALSAALAEQTVRIDAVADAASKPDDMTKALTAMLAEERKPMEINLTLQMPEQKPRSQTVRRNPDGSMSVEVSDA